MGDAELDRQSALNAWFHFVSTGRRKYRAVDQRLDEPGLDALSEHPFSFPRAYADLNLKNATYEIGQVLLTFHVIPAKVGIQAL